MIIDSFIEWAAIGFVTAIAIFTLWPELMPKIELPHPTTVRKWLNKHKIM